MIPKVLLTIALIVFVSAPSSVWAAVGLLCPSQNEPPRILIVDVEGKNISLFSLANGKWGSQSPLDVYHDRVSTYILGATIEINRQTMILTTTSDVDWRYSHNKRELNCSAHTVTDIELIAAREWDRISNSRGF